MIRIESQEDELNNVVTYKFSNGQRICLDKRNVERYGLNTLLKSVGLGDLIPTGRIDVVRRGKKIGTVPADFDPYIVKSQSMFYDIRRGDFVREGNTWVASPSLGAGDLEAVPGFVWERPEANNGP